MVKTLEELSDKDIKGIVKELREKNMDDIYVSNQDKSLGEKSYQDCRIIVCDCHGCYS